MDDYAGRVLADRYRLPLPPSDEFDLVETRAFDTYSGQEVLVRQVPLPEVVDAEMVDPEAAAATRRVSGRTTRRPTDPAVRRAIEAAQSAAQIPDHPRLDQVFDVFAEGGSLWIVSELVAARPLAALLAERPLNPYRAAEIASDVLTAVRVLHAHGWTHRNITIRTVLVCDDGRVVLTGLAAGAAEEALCGYVPVPQTVGEGGFDAGYRPAGEIPGPLPGTVPGSLPGAGHPPGTGTGIGGGARTSGVPIGPAGGGTGLPAGRTGHSEALPPGTGALGVPVGPASPGRAALETARSADGPYPDGSYGDGSYGDGSSYGTGAYGAGGGDGRYAEGRPYGDSSYGEVPHGTDAFGRPLAGHGPDTGGTETGRDGPHGGPHDPGAGDTRDPHDLRDPRDGDTGGQAPVVPYSPRPALPATPSRGGPADTRAARAGAIAAYRAGARAAARVNEDQQRDSGSVPVQRPVPLSDPSAPAGRGGGPTGGTGTAGPSQDANDPDWWAVPRDGDQPGHDTYGSDTPGQDPDPDDPQPPRRVRLAGTWHDGPSGPGDGSRPLPAGGGDPYRRAPGTPGVPALPQAGGTSPYLRQDNAAGGTGGGGGWHPSGSGDAMRADAQRQSSQLPAVPGSSASPGRWDEVVAGGTTPAYRGPATPLAAERARQARIAVVGAVTERWAPEQAGPVHENWQLAPPIGPSTDLWALGALLYRAVQGHAPYPEENAAELVQLVCSEPPAFAEECGPLRPVVESLLRQDPTERPDFEELRGWLRSLIRSAPEPDAGLDVVAVPSVDERLPIVRRRGELVRKRRGRRGDGRHRHKKAKERREKGGRSAARASHGEAYAEPRHEQPERVLPERDHRDDDFGEREYREPRGGGSRGPRSLGRVLLVAILTLMIAVIALAVMLLPKADEEKPGTGAAADPSAPTSAQPQNPDTGPDTTPDGGDDEPDVPNSSTPQTSGNPADLADGYALRKDPEGFEIGVDKTWQRRPINDSGQVRYGRGDFTLIVVPGRDTVADNGDDPLAYQRDKERELQPFRDSSWATASGLRRIDVGQQRMAEGQFTWQSSGGGEVYVRNLAMIVGDSYHIVQVIGPTDQRDKVSEIYQQATGSYRITD
ncbi:protein kinase [Streptomyces sp. NBC_01498]|uniref:protein kinase n=1 Tax=Streptomyces sp. NBC_01498 TaxID=2975870 RepID=UPI002E7B25E1|nr:protein kinase [Streptomyces sp. NBC_01498]WTL25096.1 protein kinase [Streptomyces sp. NBC_01498]